MNLPAPGSTLVLVGLMGAGKSTVGRRLAELAAGRFVDLDEEIERLSGRTIPQLFAEVGEPGFRALEALASRESAAATASERPLIVAAGGGWMVNRDARAALRDARIVWLKVSPAEAARRLAPHGAGRPLLEGPDVVRRLTVLLAERLPAYGEATYTVGTDGRRPEEVARAVAAVAGIQLDERERGK